MARTINYRKQRGFSMIEALFSAVILGIALLALAGFQAVALQDGSLIKARSVAASLAQEKLDDLRSFSRLADDPTTTGVNECGAGIFCYSEIADNAGGQEIAGTSNLVLPSGSVTGYIDNYSRTWTVSCSPEAAGSAPSFSTTCNSSTKAKLVAVTISWTDSKGADQSVSLQEVIYAMDPSKAARASVNPLSTQSPKVSYTPNSDSVPIEIGGGKSTETSKPLPEVSGGESKRVMLPSVVYTGAAGSEVLVSQEEFVTVNCTCTLRNSTTAWTPHRMVWNGSALEQEYGVEVSKLVGEPNDLNNGNTSQDPLCIECCRDHHDTNIDADDTVTGTQLYPAYRPYIGHADFDSTTGDHKHYKADGTVAAVGEDYIEACRLKRIDGWWRVVQDWLLIDLTAFGCDYFVGTATTECPPSATPVSSKEEEFRTWVKEVLQSFVHYLDDNKSVDTSTSELPSFSSDVDPLLDPDESSDDINVTQGGNKQLIARGIYADVIFEPLGTDDEGAPRNARKVDDEYVTAILPIYSADDFEKLQFLPFYDANMTLLANWSPTSTNTSGSAEYGDCSPSSPSYNITPSPSSAVCVTSEAIDTIDDPTLDYYDDFYSRGKLYGKAASGSTLITAKVARGNNGLTDSASIDGTGTPQYGASLPNTVKATIPASGSTVGVSGRVIRGNSGANLANVTIAASPATGVTCAFTSPGTLSTASAADYTCTVPSGWVGTLAFGDTDATTTYSYTPGATTASITAPATVADVIAYGETASLYGKLWCTGQACGRVAVTTSTGQTCTISGSLVTCANLALVSSAWSGTVTITNMSGYSYQLGTPATAANDCNTQTTAAKTTGTITAGPGDNGSSSSPTAFSFCAK
jgi:Tfp pilus assembly protein PilV